MSLTGLHSLGSSYQAELRSFMKKVEDFRWLPYFDAPDPKALITIGIGANIDTESKYLGYVLAELGIDGVVSEIDPTKTANTLIKVEMDKNLRDRPRFLVPSCHEELIDMEIDHAPPCPPYHPRHPLAHHPAR